ncbi:MAG: nickel-dependent lactate racemase [Clostridiales bacterium]
MEHTIGFGKTPQRFTIPDNIHTDLLLPNQLEQTIAEDQVIRQALDFPIGASRLEEIVQPKDNIVIVTSDITRPMPSKTVLPLVLQRLYDTGVPSQNITIVFALGSHRFHTESEKEELVGPEVFRRLRCIDSGTEGFVRLGITEAGTPVDIDKTVAAADLRICLGNIEYHYFAGYSGGAKAIMPGVSSHDAIQANHRMMVEDKAKVGILEGNPVRSDLEEAIALCPIHFLLNVILDKNKKVVRAFAGHYIQAHRGGCAALDQLYQKHISYKADIVIVSQGGAPKDLNLYQVQKALDNAGSAVRDGGIIILVGSCQEGMGEPVFEEWMLRANTPEELTARIKQEFVLGGHKAAAIALILRKANIYLVSEMEEAFVRKIFMRPFRKVQDALDAALAASAANPSILLMPYGGSTLPIVDAANQ